MSMNLGNFTRPVIDNKFLNIALGKQVSTVFDCVACPPRKLCFPPNWTNCNITIFHGNGDGINAPTFFTQDDAFGTPLSIAATAGNALPLIPYFFDTTRFIKIQCDTPQNQNVQVIVELAPIYQGIHN